VTLTSAAGTGGVVVGLSSSNSTDASVPSSVTVPQGATSATFTVTAGSLSSAVVVTLTASYSSAKAIFEVTIDPAAAALSSVSVTPSAVVSGQSGTGTVRLTSAAGTSGAVVSLTSSNPTAASVPLTVTVPQGATSATFPVTAGTVSSSTGATLTASFSGANATFGVTITPAAQALSWIWVSPSAIASGQSGAGIVRLASPAGASGAVVSLTSSNPAVASVPSMVMVPAGAISTTFTATAGSISSSTPVTLSASMPSNPQASVEFGVTVSPGGLPTVVSALPSSGTGLTQTFSLGFADGNGLSDLRDVMVLINDELTLNGSCAVVYDSATNHLHLYSDTGSAYSVGIAPGSAAQVSNSQCTLVGAGSSVSTFGNNMTLNVSLTFSGTFVGQKRVYLNAMGKTVNSGWVLEGTWIP
jgi:hypothetical protein